jgi:hypothetical protein
VLRRRCLPIAAAGLLLACGGGEAPDPGSAALAAAPEAAAEAPPPSVPSSPAEASSRSVPSSPALAPSSASGRPSALLLGLDGADWDVLDPLIEAGYLPNLARLVEQGARADLDCAPAMPETACFCPPVWVSIASGVPYQRHRISTIHQEVGDRKVAVLWDVLAARGGSTTLVSFRNTWPPEENARYVLTEYGLDWAVTEKYERLPREKALLRMRLRQSRAKPEGLFEDLGLLPYEGPKPPIWKSVGRDRIAMDALLRLGLRDRTDLTVALIHSPDKAGHLGWKSVQATPDAPFDREALLAQAAAWKGPVRAKRRSPGTTVASQYLETDAWLGDLLAIVSYDYVLVASDHGMTRNPGPQGMAGEHGPKLPESHQGVFILRGPGVRAGVRLEDVDVFDVAPTLAYAMGLPVAEDQPGRARSDAFDDAWRAGHPQETVPSWEAFNPRPVPQPKTPGSRSTPTGQ